MEKLNAIAYRTACKAQPLPTLVDEQLRIGLLITLAREAGNLSAVDRHLAELAEVQNRFAALKEYTA